jgi:hypothetical protein
MEFNFDNVFKDMTKAFTDGLSEEGEHIKIAGQDILDQTKARLENLATLFLAGSIDKEHFDLDIEDIKMTMENQLLAEEVRIKATAQKAINGAIDVLTTALSNILKSPI